MSQIDARFYCPDRFCEVQLDNSLSTELVVEELTSLALLTIFESIKVEHVSVACPPAPTPAGEHVLISIRAQGYRPLPHVKGTCLDSVIEDRLSCALLELFGLLDVEQCAVA